MRINPYYYLKISQKLSTEIATGEYEVDGDGNVTAYISQSGIVCHPIEITAKKIQDANGKSVLELKIPNKPGEPDNIELLSLDDSKVFEVWDSIFEKCRLEFEYTQKNNRHFLRVSSLEFGYTAGQKNIKNKGKEKISVSKEGELGVEQNSHDLQFEYEIEEIEDDLKLIIKLPYQSDELELSFGKPKAFNVWDEELQLYFPFTFTYTQRGDKFYLEISQKVSSVDLEITGEESVFRVNMNNKRGLQAVHPIKIAIALDKLKPILDKPKKDLIWDNTLRRELPLTLTYTQRGDKFYLKISQRASTARELTEFVERITNKTSGVSININEKGELFAGQGVSHPLNFNVVRRKEDDTIALICNGESVPLRWDGNPQDHGVWDQKLQRYIPLTFNFLKK